MGETSGCALCCVALCCVALCCVTLGCVGLRYIGLRWVALRYIGLRCVALRYATLRYATSRYVTLRYATLRYIALRYVVQPSRVEWAVCAPLVRQVVAVSARVSPMPWTLDTRGVSLFVAAVIASAAIHVPPSRVGPDLD